ncbi:MAG TPA: DUF1736 domain-containing protein, partial [Bacteroidia bacterium]|nr:DUF1736 domain-containing protein [Bacteroidia bacterium]
MNKKNTAPAPKLSVPTSIFNFTFNIKCVILAALAFGFYINTVNNKYALDDSLVITDNKYVQQGFSGIKHIFTSDAFDNYVKEMHGSEASASSGRWYRPLPMAIFAVEQGLFGDSPSLRHLINVLFFMLCSIAIFYFFSKYLFIAIPYGEDISFIAAFLFVIHPIHTEAVANIKSLDEIISLLFVVCTFIFSLAYSRNKKTWLLLLSLVSFLLALLSKEYAITLIILLPILFYLLITTDLKKLLRLILPFYAIIVLYGLIRISAVGIPHSMLSTDILTNPYLFATSSQQLATECYVLGKYFLLLIFPHTLSCDYSFSQIPYHNFASISVWVSIFFYIALIVWGIWLLSKKNILAFPVFFYLFNIFIISN